MNWRGVIFLDAPQAEKQVLMERRQALGWFLSNILQQCISILHEMGCFDIL